MRKLIVLALIVCYSLSSAGQEQQVTENFETYNLESVTFLPAQVKFGKFIYEFRSDGVPVDSSSLMTYFDNDGSVFVGQQKKVTEFVIRSVDGEDFIFDSFQLSSNHPYPNPDEEMLIRGWREGRVVTPPIELDVKLFEPPGTKYDFTLYQGFDKVDEIKISGNNLQFTLESFTYKFGKPSMAKEQIPVKGKN